MKDINMKPGFRVTEGGFNEKFKPVFNWDGSNLVGIFGFTDDRKNEYIGHESAIGQWQPKGTKQARKS